MGKKTRRVFDKEFKIEAVRLGSVGDRTVSEIAEPRHPRIVANEVDTGES